jgi:hypothetical protein
MNPTPLTPGAAHAARGARPGRVERAAALALVSIAAVVAASCSESTSPDTIPDGGAPHVALSAPTTPDSTLTFTVDVADELAIKYVNVSVSGAVDSSFADTLRTSQPTFKRTYKLAVPPSVPPGSAVVVVATAEDGAGNVSAPDTLNLATGNVAAPGVVITSPRAGTQAVAGKGLVLSISARTALKVKYVGYQVGGAFTTADSTFVGTSPMRDSVAILDTLSIPASTTGAATVTPFVVDSLGQRGLGASVALSVVTSAQSNSVPTVIFDVTDRIEVKDTLHVEATDPAGISFLGYEMRDSANRVVVADSAALDGKLTTVPRTFRLSLPVTTFPTRLFVQAFARNTNNVRAVAGGTAAQIDTVIVVAGVTRSLPNGGTVADAYYHRRLDRLFLTNVQRNQVEVFSLADSTFKAGIAVGSRPWGIVPWPRSRGSAAVGDDAGDTLLVANSGGTNISYVNVAAGTNGREVYRYPLPNIIVYTVKTAKDQLTGVLIPQRTVYDFSDRPQFLAATCTGATAPGNPCGDVKLVYSTTPTGGQPLPFPNKGTIRWENLTRKTSHFFFEQALGQTAGSSDTLEIERLAARDESGALVGSDSLLVPFANRASDGTNYFQVIRIPELAFRDTTFVRNSGNFARAVLGEGGDVLGSRAITYDATVGLEAGPDPLRLPGVTYALPVVDAGISKPVAVSDFIANTFQRVRGAGINFDGELSAIRGDSTYIVSSLLRLQGLLPTAGNSGFDFHPRNTGQNSTPLNTRLAFAASGEPTIEIYDTHCYQRVSTIPVRDPIVGPIKSAVRNGRIVLVGATARGVVIVSLDDTFPTTCP